MSATIYIALPLLIALVGWIVWSLIREFKLKDAVAEMGRACLYAGLIVYILTMATRGWHC